MKRNKKQPIVYVIAGPNGSGKTTFATNFLPLYAKCDNFINADLIAKGLSPFAPQREIIKAGRILLEQIHSLGRSNKDFAFETTLSGKTYLRFLHLLKKKGYLIHLYFLWIPNINLSIARVKERVRSGGHNIPIKDIRRRFSKCSKNFFQVYKQIADYWALIDNSQIDPQIIAHGNTDKVEVFEEELFRKISKKEGV